ncbi:MAG: disulfide bond formation protein B [Pseudomonadota bacterium]
MNQTQLIFTASAGSLAMLIAAFGFQYLGGLMPCQMCLWQRWPHAIAVLIGSLAVVLAQPSLAWIGALSAATTAGIGLYHAGVELRWWPGPASCSGAGEALSEMDGAALLSLEVADPLVMCDEVVWSFLGVSMAGWNAIIALGLTCVWISAARMSRAPG